MADIEKSPKKKKKEITDCTMFSALLQIVESYEIT